DLRKEIRKAGDDSERLLKAVGVEALRRRIPRALADAVEELYGPLDDVGTAELALVAFGVRVLQEYAPELEEAKLTPPSRWGGGRRAVEFVRRLGFATEYAGFYSPARAAT